MADRPLVLYKDTEAKSDTPTAEEADRAYDKWLDKKRKEKDSKGDKLNLNEWINNG